jgi:hypothetical protein
MSDEIEALAKACQRAASHLDRLGLDDERRRLHEAAATLRSLSRRVEEARAEGYHAAREASAQVADEWLAEFGTHDFRHIPPGKCARDAVADIRDAIRALPVPEETDECESCGGLGKRFFSADGRRLMGLPWPGQYESVEACPECGGAGRTRPAGEVREE